MKIASSEFVSRFFRISTRLLLNKYWLAGFIFVVWISFFDKNSFITQLKLNRSIKELRQQKSYLIHEIEVTRSLKQDLDKNVEKYARERFFMKKPGEKVFIIE